MAEIDTERCEIDPERCEIYPEDPELSAEETELLRILGAVDSLFDLWPNSKENNKTCFAISERQRAYSRGIGIPWTISGTDAQRKAGERCLTALSTDGFIETPITGGRHRQVSLTAKGDDHARSLLEFYRAADSWPLLAAIAQAVQNGPGIWASVGKVAESVEGSHLEAIALLAPLQARGFLEAGVTTIEETVVTIREPFWARAAGDAPELLADPSPNSRANPVYWQSWRQAQAAKLTWKPSRANCVYVTILN